MTSSFSAASHHDLLMLLVQLTILLLTARLFGELVQRFGQPSVVGEILAGIILGPSLLSSLFPELSELIIPHNEVQGHLLELVAMLGVMFLLLITGLETDLSLIRRHLKTAAAASFGGLVVMFSAGFVFGTLLSDDLLAQPDERLIFALFIAIGLSIAAIPVIAKVLMDLDLMRRDAGQTIIAAAMLDDSIGWILLSVVIGMASGAASAASVLGSIAQVLGLVIFSLTIGLYLTRRAVHIVQNHISSREKMLSMMVIWMFLGGAITQLLGLEALFGAFLVGIIFGQISGLGHEQLHKLESITFGIFSPIFFAVAGLKINVGQLLTPRLLLLTLLVILVATVFKVGGVYLGSRLLGKEKHWTALFFAFGLNTRGSMGVIIASIGLELGILSQAMFSMLVVMSVVTSFIAPVALRLIIKRVEINPEEQKRLQRELLLRDNLVSNIHRVLLPVRVRGDASPIQTAEARILERIGSDNQLSVTLFTVNAKGEESASAEYLNRVGALFRGHTIVKKSVTGGEPANQILTEASQGYDLIVLGAPQKTQDTHVLFTPITDYLARFSSVPLLIVHAPSISPDWQPRRILVPTNGSTAAKRAAEVGFALASGDPDAEVRILKVVGAEQSSYAIDNYRLVEGQVNISNQIVGELQTIGESFGAVISTQVEVARRPSTAILEAARQELVDLIILGVSARAGSDRLYLGPMVEYILNHASCPVLVVNTTGG